MATSSVEVIGRDAERDAIGAFLDRPRPRWLTIEGDAGIGKTTLWTLALERAAARGDRVVAWRASRAETGLAFAALTGLIGTDLDETVAGLADVRRRSLEAALGRVDAAGRPPDPSLVGLAILDVLRAIARHSPVVVAVDDAPWCDAPTADALAFAARRLRDESVAFVVTVRPETAGAPAATSLAGTSDDARTERIRVGPLTIGAVGRLIHERTGVAHPRPLLVRIHEASRGNPFVALEMSRSIVTRGIAPTPGEPFPVSPEAGPLVRDHLASLSEPARAALLFAALTPQPTLGLLDRLLGTPADAAVDEACRSGVLVAEGNHLRAAHPLYASTVYADAAPGERRAAHRALADAVDDPLERAVHRAATTERGDPEVAAELVAAARLSLGRGAPGPAADLLVRAASLVEPDAAAPLLVDAAAARLQSGDAEGATELLRDVLARTPGGRRRAEVLLALGEIVYLERPAEALALLVEALDHTDGDPRLAATVHVHIAVMGDADTAVGVRSARAAVETLERAGVAADDELLAYALLERAFQWLLRGERLALDDIDRAIAVLDLAGEPRDGGTVRRDRGDSFLARSAQERAERVLYHVGRLRASLALDAAEYDRLVARGAIGLLPPIVQSMAVLEQLVGDWPAARRHARECLDLVEGGEEVWRERAVMATARILAWDGDLDAARSLAADALAREEADGDTWEAIIFCALLGFIELSLPDPAAALGYLTRADDYARALKVDLPTVFRYLGDLVEAAVLGGDLELAERALVERLEAPAERIPLPWILEVAARGRGLLAAARGDLDEAVGWFDRGLDVLALTELPFERGRTLLARGATQLRAGRRRLARDDLDAAAAIFDGLGASAWSRRAARELARIGGHSASRWALTPSERSVADLAAAGRSNREIADQLVLSVRTVESHLASSYRKLEVRSRSQLASALARATAEGDAG